jgi:AmmeMemoRadiSam system protein B
MAATVRRPAVAGRFYPRKPEDLRAEVGAYTQTESTPIAAIGCVAPHAGYMYSGHVAGAVFARVMVPERCIVLCPNHTGQGRPLAVMSEGSWETPLGTIPLDHELASALQHNCSRLQEDGDAHRGEHAVEVQLPFLQLRQPALRLVPIAVGTSRYEVLEGLGEAMATAIQSSSAPVLIVASSDMNHYEPDAPTRRKDALAIEKMLALDPHGLYDVVTQHDISMCGFGPAVAMLTAANKLGARKAELVKYATSGDISGDREQVVGYAGVVVC